MALSFLPIATHWKYVVKWTNFCIQVHNYLVKHVMYAILDCNFVFSCLHLEILEEQHLYHLTSTNALQFWEICDMMEQNSVKPTAKLSLPWLVLMMLMRIRKNTSFQVSPFSNLRVKAKMELYGFYAPLNKKVLKKCLHKLFFSFCTGARNLLGIQQQT